MQADLGRLNELLLQKQMTNGLHDFLLGMTVLDAEILLTALMYMKVAILTAIQNNQQEVL